MKLFSPTALLKLVMAGVQAHIGSPLDSLRQIGMAVGESLMNRLHPSLLDKHKLKFDYQPSPEVQALLQLTRYCMGMARGHLSVATWKHFSGFCVHADNQVLGTTHPCEGVWFTLILCLCQSGG